MSTKMKYLVGLLILVLLAASWIGLRIYQEVNKRASEDPLVWANDITAFETTAQKSPPPNNAIVFVGSSSIRFWHSLAQDMAPLPVIQRGFGGAKLNDLVHYADRLVNNYQPQALVVFAGSNDITPGSVKTPQQLLYSYQQFVAAVRVDNPQLPIYYIGITPSPRRWEIWPDAQAANAIIEDYSQSTAGLFYIDTGPALLNAEGKPDTDNYTFDSQHLSDQGYRHWTAIIRPRLLADLAQF
ncbi:MAG: lysophospholipase L1-like esterase [Arenicella sp.]|jgi:lysophospholipase L1-like esterase